jgi:hypothetical protein
MCCDVFSNFIVFLSSILVLKDLVESRGNARYLSLRNATSFQGTVFSLSDQILPTVVSSYFKFIQVLVNTLTLNNAHSQTSPFLCAELLGYLRRGLQQRSKLLLLLLLLLLLSADLFISFSNSNSPSHFFAPSRD